MTHQLFEDVVGFVGRCRSEVAAIGEQVAMEMGERFSVQGKNPIFRRRSASNILYAGQACPTR